MRVRVSQVERSAAGVREEGEMRGQRGWSGARDKVSYVGFYEGNFKDFGFYFGQGFYGDYGVKKGYDLIYVYFG